MPRTYYVQFNGPNACEEIGTRVSATDADEACALARRKLLDDIATNTDEMRSRLGNVDFYTFAARYRLHRIEVVQ